MKAQQVSVFQENVVAALGLSVTPGTPIYLGASNVAHMQAKHPADYAKYGGQISLILSSPDYVHTNPKDGSVEYVKEFQIDGDFVKVAVRVTGAGTWFARSLYILNAQRVQNFIKKGTLKKP